MSQLPIHPSTPSEKPPLLRNRRRVIRPARDLNDDRFLQCLHETGDVLPAVVAVAETTVVASTPGVDVTGG